MNQIDEFWHPLIPNYTVRKSRDIFFRPPVPFFSSSASVSVALFNGASKPQLLGQIELAFKNNPDYANGLHGFAIVLDADLDYVPDLAANIQNRMSNIFPDFPAEAGAIAKGEPNLGLYVMPNNSENGCLETLLEECISTQQVDLKKSAQASIDQCPKAVLDEWQGHFATEKAFCGIVANLLRPGKSTAVAIKDCAWVTKKSTEDCPNAKGLFDFLHDLLE